MTTDPEQIQALDYYVIERQEKLGRGESQWEVGKLVRRLTQLDWAVGYYNYPFRGGSREFEHSPDLVLLHADIGLAVITCRDYELEEIEEITNEDWKVRGDYDRPVPEVQEQLAHIQSQISGTRDLMDFWQYADRVDIVALPEISHAEWNKKDLPEPNTNLFFEEHLTHDTFKTSLLDVTDNTDIPDDLFKKARKRMNQGDILSADRDPIPAEQLSNKKRDLYRAATWGFDMHEQDKEQEQIGLHIPPGPQQIRGIAGSGKTTIMAKKAAAMHTKHPDWNIAFTFNTRALYQTITETISDFYRDFTNGMEPDGNLEVLHAWGQKPENVPDNEKAEGLYRKVALAAGIEPYRMRHSLPGFGSLNTHAADLVTGNEDIPQMYDAIFIDEAQDFKPGFYRMCYEALREPKRLIWAYDEAQSLNSLSAPSPKEIFDKDEAEHRSEDLSGMYEGGVRKSFVMRQSYRTPRDILMAAHSLGMGLYRDDGIVHTLTNKQDWDSIGYQVDNDCSFADIGSEIRISRRRDLSPHPLQSHVDPGDLLDYSFHKSVQAEARAIAQDVLDDIVEEELDPNDVMVVCVGPKDYNEKGIETARNIRAKNIVEVINDVASRRMDNKNIARVAAEGSRDEFWKPGKITVAGTDRAKGNEAASIHVAGAEQIYFDNWESAHRNSSLVWREDYVQVRNEILVALTRSEGWCNIHAVGDSSNPFIKEIQEVCEVVCEENPNFVFQAPDPQEMTGQIMIDESVPTRGVREKSE